MRFAICFVYAGELLATWPTARGTGRPTDDCPLYCNLGLPGGMGARLAQMDLGDSDAARRLGYRHGRLAASQVSLAAFDRTHLLAHAAHIRANLGGCGCSATGEATCVDAGHRTHDSAFPSSCAHFFAHPAAISCLCWVTGPHAPTPRCAHLSHSQPCPAALTAVLTAVLSHALSVQQVTVICSDQWRFSLAATGCKDGRVRLFDAAAGSILCILSGLQGQRVRHRRPCSHSLATCSSLADSAGRHCGGSSREQALAV